MNVDNLREQLKIDDKVNEIYNDHLIYPTFKLVI